MLDSVENNQKFVHYNLRSLTIVCRSQTVVIVLSEEGRPNGVTANAHRALSTADCLLVSSFGIFEVRIDQTNRMYFQQYLPHNHSSTNYLKKN